MQLVPVRATTKDISERLLEMERQGRIRIGTGKLPKDFWKRPFPKLPDGLTLERIFEEEREDRA